MRIVLSLIISCSFLTSSISQDCQQLEGSWQNELGSVLVIDSIHSNGTISGKYLSSTGVDGKVFPLQGWVNNYRNPDGSATSIAFSVRWEGYESITSWTGSCSSGPSGEPQIKTMWHLVRPKQEFSWERIIVNSSVFKPL